MKVQQDFKPAIDLSSDEESIPRLRSKNKVAKSSEADDYLPKQAANRFQCHICYVMLDTAMNLMGLLKEIPISLSPLRSISEYRRQPYLLVLVRAGHRGTEGRSAEQPRGQQFGRANQPAPAPIALVPKISPAPAIGQRQALGYPVGVGIQSRPRTGQWLKI